jgi:hypothetical protein
MYFTYEHLIKYHLKDGWFLENTQSKIRFICSFLWKSLKYPGMFKIFNCIQFLRQLNSYMQIFKKCYVTFVMQQKLNILESNLHVKYSFQLAHIYRRYIVRNSCF